MPAPQVRSSGYLEDLLEEEIQMQEVSSFTFLTIVYFACTHTRTCTHTHTHGDTCTHTHTHGDTHTHTHTHGDTCAHTHTSVSCTGVTIRYTCALVMRNTFACMESSLVTRPNFSLEPSGQTGMESLTLKRIVLGIYTQHLT